MSQNPYQPPGPTGASPDPAAAEEARDALRRIAGHRLRLKLAFLAYLAYIAATGWAPPEWPRALGPMAIAMLAVHLVALFSVLQLGLAIHGRSAALVGGLFMFLPCLHLITVLVFISSATEHLRKAGARVSFFGAELPDPNEPAPLAGSACAQCGETIVEEGGGVRCKRCGSPLHAACRKAHRRAAHPKV